MTTIDVNESVSAVGSLLADRVSELAGLTESVKDTTSTYILKHLEPRLRQGLVRIAVVGITGAGKSTLINGLVEHPVLPENPSISTPIPVWIGYHDKEESMADIYESHDGKVRKNTCDIDTFRRKYCYNMSDIMDKDRTRYNAVEFGAINVSCPVLQGNVTLIDTLGISATTVDSRKTIRVLEEGVDAVIFVTKNSKPTKEEMRFLYRYVLGCHDRQEPDQEKCNARPIRPENLLFVNNNWYGVPDKTEFAERVRTFYRNSDLTLTEEQINTFAAENVFYVNAFKARMGRMGIYPYGTSAPEGSTSEELEAYAELEAYEREILAASDSGQLLEESGIQLLSQAVCQLGQRLGFGENAVSVRRIGELIPVVDGVIQTANTRIAETHISIAELEEKKKTFEKMRQDDEADQKNIRTAVKKLSKEYETGFIDLLEAITPELVTDCAGRAKRKVMPQSLRTQFQAYKQMSNAEREQYLSALLPEEIKATYEYCSQQMIKALDERRTDDFKTPFAVMEDTRTFMSEQVTLLNSRIGSLRKAGGEELGMFFPDSMIVEELFKKLELDLEEKVKEIIADACISGGIKFEEKMDGYVKRCKLNLFQSLLGLVLTNKAPKWLWENIKENLFVPLAKEIVTGMPEHTVNSIIEKTAAAFDATKEEICSSHIELFVSLKITLSQLENKIRSAGENAAEVEVDMNALKESCEKIKSEILQLQYRLQHAQ